MSGKPAMIDIAGLLNSARADSRWIEAAEDALGTIAQETGLRLSWDKGAGEDWASLLRDHAWAAMISASVSLAVTGDPDTVPVMKSNGVAEVIVVHAYQQPCMRCDLATLKETFKYDHGWTTVVSPDSFSAEDLWWTTI